MANRLSPGRSRVNQGFGQQNVLLLIVSNTRTNGDRRLWVGLMQSESGVA